MSIYLEHLCESVGGPGASYTADTIGCFACSFDKPAAVIDRDYGSFTLLDSPLSGSARIRGTTSPGAASFPAGRSAGGLIRLPDGGGSVNFEMIVRTYRRDQPEIPVDYALAYSGQDAGPSGGGAGFEPRATRGRDGYYGIVTTGEYDSVELELAYTVDCGVGTCGQMRIYEICTR